MKGSKTTEEHRRKAPAKIRAAVITVSDSKFDYLWSKRRSLEEAEDTSGRSIIDGLKGAGHEVLFYTIIPDHEGLIVEMIDHIIGVYDPDVIITTGGTGITRKDVTVEAVTAIFEKSIEGFGELFRARSMEEVGGAALLSRAVAGVCQGVLIFSLPGSPNAVRVGLEIILKEVRHLVKHAKE
ncbi:MAG: MogA/MoaB family molybdenum cofactor biosynthesis protein [Candidatus Hydrothermarchaeota archaeon]|mgnify:CR=1 FL=1